MSSDGDSEGAPVSATHHVRVLRICVELEGRKTVFHLGPRDLRAIVIGEVTGADVRVQGPHVPEIACHLERDGDAVCLVPAYARDLQVDGVPVATVCVLPWRARLSFSGVHLAVSIAEHLPPRARAKAAG